MADNSCNEETVAAKPGWQTTEFYVTVLTAVVPVTTLVFHRDFSGAIQPIATVVACITTSVYTVARAHSKHTAINATAAVRVAKYNAQASTAIADTATSAATAARGATVTNVGANAAVPIDTLALILAKLDRLVDEQHEKVAL